jgi:hypothetical protein
VCPFCSAGYGSESYGADKCIECPAGRYQGSIGAIECLECRAGKYAEAGADSCTFCGDGQYAPRSSESVAACTDCPLGRFNLPYPNFSGDNCTICENGTKRGSSDNAYEVSGVCEVVYITEVRKYVST